MGGTGVRGRWSYGVRQEEIGRGTGGDRARDGRRQGKGLEERGKR